MLIKLISISQILRLLVGIIFLFSGLIKLNDPLGFALTIQTYLQGFAIDFSSLFLKLIPYSLVIAISVCVVEVILGIALLTKFKLKLIIRALFLLTGFFTLLTLYTLWFGRVNSCGCLSNAIPLTPRQSFIKNICLLLALHLLHKHTTYAKHKSYAKFTLGCLISIGILSVGIGWYTSSGLPIIDFGPYQVGSNISTLIRSSNTSQYKHRLESEKNKSISVINIHPTNTPYYLLKTQPVHSTSNPRVANFIIWDEEKEITQEILEGNKLICIIQQPFKLNTKDKVVLEEFVGNILSPLSISWLLPLHEEKENLPPFIINHLAWGTIGLLRSIMKADTGFILLQNGVVTGKWSYRDLYKLKKELAKRRFYAL